MLHSDTPQHTVGSASLQLCKSQWVCSCEPMWHLHACGGEYWAPSPQAGQTRQSACYWGALVQFALGLRELSASVLSHVGVSCGTSSVCITGIFPAGTRCDYFLHFPSAPGCSKGTVWHASKRDADREVVKRDADREVVMCMLACQRSGQQMMSCTLLLPFFHAVVHKGCMCTPRAALAVCCKQLPCCH